MMMMRTMRMMMMMMMMSKRRDTLAFVSKRAIIVYFHSWGFLSVFFFFSWTSSLSLVFRWWQATERNPASPTSAVTTHFQSFTSHHLKALNRLLNSKSIFPNKFQVRLCNIVVYRPNLITSNKHHQWLVWHFFFFLKKG